jgi:methylase of polypeptide subunit release factors
MSPLTEEAPLAVDRPDLVHRVREVFDRAGFDEKHIYDRFGVGEQGQLTMGPLDRPRLLWRTRNNDQLSTLLRVFLVEVPVELTDFRQAIAPMDPADWANLGLVTLDGTTVRGAVTLRASGKLVIAHDCSMPAGGKRPDYVLGVTGATLTLSGVTVRPPSRRTLDLGTGSGFQALTAATHSEQVVGTDRNPRAIAIARFNTLLNGITNVEFVTGDLFEPVSDLQFDLIVSNPPFVISPENQLQYRDSGYRGDEICERIVRAGPEHLAEGGYLQVLCNWVRDPGEGWRERLLGWIDGSGCDAQIIHNSTSTIDVYANHWLRQTEIATEDRLAEAFHRWIAYYEQFGIEAVDMGLITLRRRSASTNWVRFETDRRRNHPNGAGILATFAARDLLDRIGENTQDLLALKLRCKPELRVLQRLEPADSGWVVENAQCLLGKDLEFEGRLDQAAFHLLTLCRGRQPLSAVLAQVAARTGQNPDELLPASLDLVRSLISQGFLWPVDQDGLKNG